MNELLIATLWWMPVSAVPVLLVLCAPTASSRFRTAAAAAMVVGAIASLVFAAMESDTARELSVINPFIDPGEGRPIPFVMEVVQAPGWHGPSIGAALLLVPAALLFIRRRQEPAVPCPVVFSSVITLWTLAARLGLEKCAAPEGLTWSTGVTFPTLLMLPFVGWWSGTKNAGVPKFALIVLLLAIIQRSLIVGWSYFATSYGLGTHLDVGSISKITVLAGPLDFTGPGDVTTDQWLALVAIPQYLLWVPFTLASGALLGGLPFALARRRYLSRNQHSE